MKLEIKPGSYYRTRCGARHGFLVDTGVENCGEWAYKAADSMLAAREGGAE